MSLLNVAVVGATGAVGQELLKVMAERNFPFKDIKMLASKRSAGKKMEYMGKTYTIEETTAHSFAGIDIALFAGGSASKEFAQEAAKQGVVVIDNSSAFRLDPEVPLVVPEVNPEDVKLHKGLIANPNCSTIIMAVALKPLYDASKINRVVVSTYQAVSGAGKEAIDELDLQVKQILNNEDVKPEVFPYQIAYNLIPHIDVFVDGDFTKEEMKMVNETHKIFNDNNIKITPTTVRVPVYRSHSESIYIETDEKISAVDAKRLLSQAQGIKVVDDPANKLYPMPLDTSDQDLVWVGRIREDLFVNNGLNMWVVGDQIRKGAATNAIQIAELVVKEKLY